MTQKFQELSKLIEYKNTEFVIPNFVLYDWDTKRCKSSWDNTIKNIENKSGVLSKNLAYENQHGGLTIIDKHSNLTTFILLCRALYEHLVSQPNIQQSCLEQLAKRIIHGLLRILAYKQVLNITSLCIISTSNKG